MIYVIKKRDQHLYLRINKLGLIMEIMNVVVWVLQICLAVTFIYFGTLKMFLPIEKIEKKVTWAHDYSVAKLKAFGFLEIIGALGILLPWRLGIFPILTPVAATGLAMVMAGAGMVHLKRDEGENVAIKHCHYLFARRSWISFIIRHF